MSSRHDSGKPPASSTSASRALDIPGRSSSSSSAPTSPRRMSTSDAFNKTSSSSSFPNSNSPPSSSSSTSRPISRSSSAHSHNTNSSSLISASSSSQSSSSSSLHPHQQHRPNRRKRSQLADDDELSLLCNSAALANTGLAVVCAQDNASGYYAGGRSTSTSEGESFGKIIFALEELPVDTSWTTPKGRFLARVSEDEVKFFAEGSMVVSLEVRPSVKTIMYLPDSVLKTTFALLPAAPLLASRRVSREWRRLVDPLLPPQLYQAIQIQTARDMFAMLPVELRVHILRLLGPGELGRMSCTCRQMWSILEDNEDSLWKHLYLSRWSAQRNRLVHKKAHPDLSWKAAYATNDALLRVRCFAGNYQKYQAELLSCFQCIADSMPTPVPSPLPTPPPSPSAADIRRTTDPAQLPQTENSDSTNTNTNETNDNEDKTQTTTTKNETLTTNGVTPTSLAAGLGLGSNPSPKLRSKHPVSAEFLRTFQTTVPTPLTPQSTKRFVANVLVLGPKGIGKSSFLMRAIHNKFKSNPALDLDNFGAQAEKTLKVDKAEVCLRFYCLSRMPDYNDLFNIGAVIICYDLSSPSASPPALAHAARPMPSVAPAVIESPSLTPEHAPNVSNTSPGTSRVASDLKEADESEEEEGEALIPKDHSSSDESSAALPSSSRYGLKSSGGKPAAAAGAGGPDVTSTKRWMREVWREGPQNAVIAVVGLRKDLAVGRRLEDYARAKDWSLRAGASAYREVSSKKKPTRGADGATRFDGLFRIIARRLLQYPELCVGPIFMRARTGLEANA